MEKYNLDEKGGLFKFNVKSPSKVVKKGDSAQYKHFSSCNSVQGELVDVTDTSIKVMSKDKTPDIKLTVGDPIVVNCKPSGDMFVFSGDISDINSVDPYEFSVAVSKIDKMKELQKDKRYCVSYPAQLKIIGVADSKTAVVKNISFGGIKFNCSEDIMLEDIIDVAILIDKVNKLTFKGRVVRKNKLHNTIEYGVELGELTETNNKLLTRIMYDFENL